MQTPRPRFQLYFTSRQGFPASTWREKQASELASALLSEPGDTGRSRSGSRRTGQTRPQAERGRPGIARHGPPAGEVDGRALAHPRRAFAQDRVGHQVHQLVPNRALEHAALAKGRERQQMQFAADDGAGREPGLAGRALVAGRRRVKADGDARRRRDAEGARDVAARLRRSAARSRRARLRRRPAARGRRRRRPTARPSPAPAPRRARPRRGAARTAAGAGTAARPRDAQRRRWQAARDGNLQAGEISIENLGGRPAGDGQVHRADDAHADAVAGPTPLEAVRVADALELERRALDELPAERPADDGPQILPGDFLGRRSRPRAASRRVPTRRATGSRKSRSRSPRNPPARSARVRSAPSISAVHTGAPMHASSGCDGM